MEKNLSLLGAPGGRAAGRCGHLPCLSNHQHQITFNLKRTRKEKFNGIRHYR
jgi:hypothetical protein